jgi:hypothetical protein
MLHAVLGPPPHWPMQFMTAHLTLSSKQVTHASESMVIILMQFLVAGSAPKFCVAQLVTSVWRFAPIVLIFIWSAASVQAPVAPELLELLLAVEDPELLEVLDPELLVVLDPELAVVLPPEPVVAPLEVVA